MPYTFSLPGFFSGQNLDEYGRVLLRKGISGIANYRGSRRGPPTSTNDLLNHLFPNSFGGPSSVPRREPRDTGSIGGLSNISGGLSYISDQDGAGKGSISSLPKIKDTTGKTAQLIYRWASPPFSLAEENQP